MLRSRRWSRWLIGLLIGVMVAASKPTASSAGTFSVTYVRQWGSSGTGNGQFNATHAVGFNPVHHYVYVADEANHRIQYFDANGAYLGQWGGYGSANGEFISPGGIAVSADGGKVYVVERDNHRVQYFNATGQYLGQWGTQGSGNGQFMQPAGVAVANDNTVYVADRGNHRIQHFSATGAYLGQFGMAGGGNGQFSSPMGIAVGLTDTLYVADAGNYRVQYFSATGEYQGQWGSKGSNDDQFNGYDPSPTGIAHGSDGAVLVADSGQNLIKVFGPTGQFLGKWGGYGNGHSQFYFPNNAVMDLTNTVYIGDELNNRVQAFTVITGLEGSNLDKKLYLPLMSK
jgi:tripartite motif-containing protein 71